MTDQINPRWVPMPEPRKPSGRYTEIAEALNNIAAVLAVNAEQASDHRALDDMANMEYRRVCVERDNWKEDARVRALNVDYWQERHAKLVIEVERIAKLAATDAENPFTEARRMSLLEMSAQLRNAAKGGV